MPNSSLVPSRTLPPAKEDRVPDDRDVHLTGPDAVDWLGKRGWHVRSYRGTFRLNADLIWTDTFAIGRIWHTPAEIEIIGSDTEPNVRAIVVVGVSGDHQVVNEAGTHTLRPGDHVVHGNADLFSLITHEPASRVVLATLKTRLTVQNPDLLRNGTPVSVASTIASIFISAAHASLASPMTEASAAFPAWRRGLENLLAASLDSTARDRYSFTSYAQSEEIGRAMAVIDSNATDPSFTIRHLATDLVMSKSRLHAVFDGTGTTPGQLLRRTRVNLANAHLREARPTGAELARVAKLSGFGSVRSLQRALAEQRALESGEHAAQTLRVPSPVDVAVTVDVDIDKLIDDTDGQKSGHEPQS